MKTTIVLFPQGIIDQSFLVKARQWAGEVVEKTGQSVDPGSYFHLPLGKRKGFSGIRHPGKSRTGCGHRRRVRLLGDSRGLEGIPQDPYLPGENPGDLEEVVRGIVQHEIAHALLHGRPEFYQFRFSNRLLEAGQSAGLDFPMIQRLVYFLSIAVKDEAVVRFLAEAGLGLYQIRLLEYLMEDTEEERRAWELIRDHPVLRRLGLAAFLKIRLPIETLIGLDLPESGLLQEKWEAAYAWLTDQGEKALKAYVQTVMDTPYINFQDRLERAVPGVD